MREHLRRFTGFSLLPAFSLLASLVLLPLVSSGHGSGGFVALAIGQSVGAIISVIASLAWPVIGGHAVAVAEESELREIFALSIYSRLFVLLLLLPIGVGTCLLLVQDYRLATCLFMIGIAFNAMSAGWFYSGRGEPRHLVVNEGLVRLGGYAIAVAALSMGAPLVTYAALTAAAGLISLTLNWVHVLGWAVPAKRGLLAQTLGTIAEHRFGTMSRVLQSGFAFGGPSIYALFSPGTLALYAALDQMQKATGNAVAVFPQTFVAWVGRDPGSTRRRSRAAFLVMVGAAVTVVCSWVLMGPLVISVLFSGEVEISRLGCTLVGLSVAAVLLAKTYELLVMIPMGMEREVFRTDSAFAILGLAVLTGASATGVAYLAISSWTVVSFLMLGHLMFLVRTRINEQS